MMKRRILPGLCASLAALALACNGDDSCKVVTPAAGDGATLAVDSETFVFGMFTSSPNNDCPTGGPEVSITVAGQQVQPATGFPLTFCLPRPEKIGEGPIDLADTALVQLVDASARGDNLCSYTKDPAATPTGTLVFSGFCTDAGHTYNLTVDGQVAGTELCPGDAGAPVSRPVTLVIGGTFSVRTL